MAYDLHKEVSKMSERRKKAILWYDAFADELKLKINTKGRGHQSVLLSPDELIYLRDACIEEKQRLLGH